VIAVAIMIKKQRIQEPVKDKLKNIHSRYITPTECDDLSLPALIVFQGQRGSGKTHAAVALAKHFERRDYIQRTFLLCPNTDKDKDRDIFSSNLRTLDDDDVCSDEMKFSTALQQVVERVREDWEKVEQQQNYDRAYVKFLAKKPLTEKEEGLLISHNYTEPTAVVPIKRHLLILDDCLGTDVYSQARASTLTHLSIRHRHIPITIMFLVQSFMGLPRTIRLNATHYCIFKTGDLTQLEQIYSTFANSVDRDTFMKVYHEATAQDYGFLLIDVVPKQPYQRFRSNFHTYLIPEQIRTSLNSNEKTSSSDHEDS